MKVLLTGGSGFIGRNILPILSSEHQVLSPTRAELDLSSGESVDRYLSTSDADVLVNCAIVNPAKEIDRGKSVFHETISAYRRFSAHPFSRIINIGSGAEYDKSRDIGEVTEDELSPDPPGDEYGHAKHEINTLIRNSGNATNLRIFGCYGPGEPERRFLRHAITCCLRGEPITIRRDCRFSYVFVNDLGAAILKVLKAKSLGRRDYNLCGGEPHYLSELAEIVKGMTSSGVPVTINESGLANEYTGSDLAFRREFSDFNFTPVKDGIATEINWLKNTLV